MITSGLRAGSMHLAHNARAVEPQPEPADPQSRRRESALRDSRGSVGSQCRTGVQQGELSSLFVSWHETYCRFYLIVNRIRLRKRSHIRRASYFGRREFLDLPVLGKHRRESPELKTGNEIGRAESICRLATHNGLLLAVCSRSFSVL